MNELSNAKMMSTRELAEVLGVSLRTVQQVIADKGYEVNFIPFQTKGGIQKMACVNEKIATAIKLELQNHSKVNDLSPKTDLEKMLFVAKAMQMQQEIIEELQAKNTEMLPKAQYFDEFADSTSLIEIGHLGKKTGIGAKNIFPFMVVKKIIYKKVVDGIEYYEPYKDYEKYFTSVEKPFTRPDGTKKSRSTLYLTSKGYEYFLPKFSRTIEETADKFIEAELNKK